MSNNERPPQDALLEREPLFASHIAVNCGCGWHPIGSHGNASLISITELFTILHKQAIQHVSDTGHAVEIRAEIRPYSGE